MHILVLLHVHEEIPCQTGDNRDEDPNFTAKPLLGLGGQEEFHQHHKPA